MRARTTMTCWEVDLSDVWMIKGRNLRIWTSWVCLGGCLKELELCWTTDAELRTDAAFYSSCSELSSTDSLLPGISWYRDSQSALNLLFNRVENPVGSCQEPQEGIKPSQQACRISEREETTWRRNNRHNLVKGNTQQHPVAAGLSSQRGPVFGLWGAAYTFGRCI